MLRISVSFGILAVPVPCAHAGIAFFDSVTTPQTPVFLKVLTRGTLFSEGGRRVDIYTGDRRLGTILSGGDGYGFIKIIPDSAGLKTYEARMNGDSDSARLLVMEKSEGAILLEIEVLRHHFFSKSGLGDAQKVLNQLSKRFRIIYLTGLIGVTATEKLIASEKLPPSAVLVWQGKETLADLKSRHIRVDAMIGSAGGVAAAADDVGKRLTFEETEDGTLVEDWQDILKQLQ